jgi:hypothetical protein
VRANRLYDKRTSRSAVSVVARKWRIYHLLAVAVVLTGCGAGSTAQVRVAQTGRPRSEMICVSAASQLLTIARHATFDSYPIFARQLFTEGSRESESALDFAIDELKHVRPYPSRLIHKLRAVANGFDRLARATRKAGHSGERVAHADFTRYDVLSAEAETACR